MRARLAGAGMAMLRRWQHVLREMVGGCCDGAAAGDDVSRDGAGVARRELLVG